MRTNTQAILTVTQLISAILGVCGAFTTCAAILHQLRKMKGRTASLREKAATQWRVAMSITRRRLSLSSLSRHGVVSRTPSRAVTEPTPTTNASVDEGLGRQASEAAAAAAGREASEATAAIGSAADAAAAVAVDVTLDVPGEEVGVGGWGSLPVTPRTSAPAAASDAATERALPRALEALQQRFLAGDLRRQTPPPVPASPYDGGGEEAASSQALLRAGGAGGPGQTPVQLPGGGEGADACAAAPPGVIGE